jgi:hypothetical protein
MREGPCNVGETQPAGHATGAINVIVIIVTHPIEVRRLSEDNPDQRGKREDDQDFLRLQTEARLYTPAEGANRVPSGSGGLQTAAFLGRLGSRRFLVIRLFVISSGVEKSLTLANNNS